MWLEEHELGWESRAGAGKECLVGQSQSAACFVPLTSLKMALHFLMVDKTERRI